MDVNMSVRSAQVCRLFFPLLLLASSLVSAQDQGDGGQSDEPDVEPSTPQERTSDPGGIHPYLEYRKRVEAAQSISPLDNGVFGDEVSLYNGATEFSVTDIDIPGNSVLPVQLGRRLSVELQPQSMLAPYDSRLLGVGNWDIEVPYMAAVFPLPTGWAATRLADPASARIRPVVSRSIVRQRRVFTNAVNTFDTFARQVNVIQSSAPSP